MNYKLRQAGAELCQAQAKLEVVVEFGIEVEACHYKSRWMGGWVGGQTKTKLIIISTQIEVVFEVEVEYGHDVYQSHK